MSQIALLTPSNRTQNARVAYRYAGSNIAIADGDPWRYDTESDVIDKIGEWELDTTNWAVQVKYDATFDINATVFCTSSGRFSLTGTGAFTGLEVDSGSGFALKDVSSPPIDNLRNHSVSFRVSLKKGDKFRIVTGGGYSFTQSANTTRVLTIQRQPDLSANAPYGFGLATGDIAGLVTYYRSESINVSTSNLSAAFNMNIRVMRINDRVTVTFPSSASRTKDGSAGNVNFTAAIPDWARPTTALKEDTTTGGDTAAPYQYIVIIETSGLLRFARATTSGAIANFAASQDIFWRGGSFTYSIND